VLQSAEAEFPPLPEEDLHAIIVGTGHWLLIGDFANFLFDFHLDRFGSDRVNTALL
jgi:hypothetical protein